VVFRATDNQSPVGDTSVPNQARAPVMSLDCRWSCEPWNGTRVAILETHETLKIGSRRMPWEADTFIMPAAAEEKPSVEPDELASQTSWPLTESAVMPPGASFRAAPPCCIEFDA
jgi:hypothetical protein